jgi:threonine dehydrogenase-like Zn-dependent dehydrogenase
MDEYLLIEDAEVGRSVAVLPGSLPFDIAALNEPTAVARHCVNRSEVTAEIAEHRDRFARLISHRVPFAEVGRAFELAMTPGAAEKVVVTFE